ncbi:hypothetical protein CHU98_g224 [Xylaria longipes]|nr:hypothetical protein CHU98_g224 [Xylaria longipes]
MSLCDTCTRLSINPLNSGLKGRHQDLVQELHSSVAQLKSCASHCDPCRVFWASVRQFCPPAVLQELLGGGSHKGEKRVFIVVDSEGQLPRLLPRSIVNPNRVTLSEGARNIYLLLGPKPLALNLGFVHILAEFVSAHQGSPAAEFIRGRVAIEKDSSQPRPMLTRVIDLDGGRPKLLDTHGRDGAYAALSYCRGKRRGIHKIKLRSENYDEFRSSGIEESEMTLAHREGLQITRQDKASRDDWARESTRIPEVYGNAVLTIVAGRSDDSRKGFLGSGHEPAISPAVIRCELPGAKTDVCLVGVERSQDVGATDARVWCFQESILSRRMLVFGTEQLSFRCRECVDFEDGRSRPCGDEKEWYDYTISRDWTLRANVLKAWYEVAIEYSKLDFFDPYDNFAAISGVAQQFQSALRDEGIKPRYQAGLWESDMNRGLLWRSLRLIDENQEPLRKPVGVNGIHQGQEITTAPSWSWLGLRGPISQDVGNIYNPIMLDPGAYRCFPIAPKSWSSGYWHPKLVKHEEFPLPFKLEVRGSLRKVRVSTVPVSQYPGPLAWKGLYGVKPVTQHAVLLEAAEKPALKKANFGEL